MMKWDHFRLVLGNSQKPGGEHIDVAVPAGQKLMPVSEMIRRGLVFTKGGETTQ